MDKQVEVLFPSLRSLGDSKPNDLNKDYGTLFHSIEYRVSDVVRKLLDQTVDDAEIKKIIVNQHDMLLNYDLFLKNEESRKQAQTIFTNMRFLKCFRDVVGMIPFSNHEKICLNKISYDYYVYLTQNNIEIPKNTDSIASLLFGLTTYVNGAEIAQLSAMLGIDTSHILAIIRNSSFKEDRCIKRMHRFLVMSDFEYTQQNMIDILCALTHRFSEMFVTLMMIPKPTGLTDEQSKRFDQISVAIIQMLDSLTQRDINRVVMDYANAIYVKNPEAVRCSLRLLGYPRVLNGVYEASGITRIP